MAQYLRLRWLGLRRSASRWPPGSMAIPASMMSGPACTPGLAAHQLQTSIRDNTNPPVPRYTLVLAAHRLQTSIRDNTIPSVSRCTLVLATQELQTNIPDN